MLQIFFMCHPCASAFLLEKSSAQMYLLRLRISTLLSFGNGIITIDMHFFALFNGYFPLYPQILLRYTNGSLSQTPKRTVTEIVSRLFAVNSLSIYLHQPRSSRNFNEVYRAFSRVRDHS
jgi:hypothetical protein